MNTSNLPNNINQHIASFKGKTVEFRGKRFLIKDWVRESTYFRLTTAQGNLNVPFDNVMELKVVGEKALPNQETGVSPVKIEQTSYPFSQPKEETPQEVQATEVQPQTPELMFTELAEIGMDTLRGLKNKSLKAEDAQPIIEAMEAVVKIGALQIRALEVNYLISRGGSLPAKPAQS